MSASWKFVDSRWMLLSIIFFVGSGFDIRRAMQYANATSTERNTNTYNASMRINYHAFAFIRLSKHYTCSYNFMVERVSYSGDGDCTQLSVDDSIKRTFSDSVRVLPIQNLTVYYDLSNPSLNSLTEFSARSKVENRGAIGVICSGLLICLPFVFYAVLDATKNRGNRRFYVDTKGTVIYPEEIDVDSEFGGLPSGSRTGEKSYAASSGKTAKTADSVSSWGLRELYLDVVKQIHPDHASNEADRALRERLTKEANAAYERGDDAILRKVLEEYKSMISATC
jgi:hypothetical protein